MKVESGNLALRHPQVAEAPADPSARQHLQRRLSGYAFLGGNLTLLAANLPSLDKAGLTSALLFLGASALYPFTSKHPWLFAPAGTAVILAQSILAACATGSGAILQQLGSLTPVLQGALMVASAVQHGQGSRFCTTNPLLKPLEWILKRPVLAGAALNAPSMALLGAGAALNHEWVLLVAAIQWLTGNVLMGLSDRALPASAITAAAPLGHDPALRVVSSPPRSRKRCDWRRASCLG